MEPCSDDSSPPLSTRRCTRSSAYFVSRLSGSRTHTRVLRTVGAWATFSFSRSWMSARDDVASASPNSPASRSAPSTPLPTMRKSPGRACAGFLNFCTVTLTSFSDAAGGEAASASDSERNKGLPAMMRTALLPGSREASVLAEVEPATSAEASSSVGSKRATKPVLPLILPGLASCAFTDSPDDGHESDNECLFITGASGESTRSRSSASAGSSTPRSVARNGRSSSPTSIASSPPSAIGRPETRSQSVRASRKPSTSAPPYSAASAASSLPTPAVSSDTPSGSAALTSARWTSQKRGPSSPESAMRRGSHPGLVRLSSTDPALRIAFSSADH
mmetsp:Transcript_1253/g.4660  ORF Transcript_1253/g.4660 Transcript_1253/m.4660 type:complete len:334 (-) Transcript_1253:264-1265(-)